MLWHIYRQDDDIHLDKLDAFLTLYTQDLSAPAKAALITLWQAWNTDSDMASSWKMLLEHWPELAAHAEKWCLEQALQADLATALVQFYENWI